MSTLLWTHVFPNLLGLEIAPGDLTQEPVDAIVNAANSRLVLWDDAAVQTFTAAAENAGLSHTPEF